MVLCKDANQLSSLYKKHGRLYAHWLVLHYDDSDDCPGALRKRVEIQLLLTLFWRLTAAACFGASLLSWDRCMKSNRWSILGRDLSMKRRGPAKTLISWAAFIYKNMDASMLTDGWCITMTVMSVLELEVKSWEKIVEFLFIGWKCAPMALKRNSLLAVVIFLRRHWLSVNLALFHVYTFVSLNSYRLLLCVVLLSIHSHITRFFLESGVLCINTQSYHKGSTQSYH